MKLYLKVLLASLLCATQLFAGRSDCFQKYSVALVNKSGGIADIEKSKGICGTARKMSIPNNGSIRIVIKERGAELAVKAGPEDSKSKRSIKFYSKNYRSYNPHVVLNPKGFEAEGFSQKMITFPVSIENRSGGIARVLETCETTANKSPIADGKSAKITVKPSSFIVVEYGPEKNKAQAKLVFAEQTGNNPTISLAERGFFSKGISEKDVITRTQRVAIMRPFKKRTMNSGKKNKNAEPKKAKRNGGRRNRSRK